MGYSSKFRYIWFYLSYRKRSWRLMIFRVKFVDEGIAEYTVIFEV